MHPRSRADDAGSPARNTDAHAGPVAGADLTPAQARALLRSAPLTPAQFKRLIPRPRENGTGRLA